MSYDVWDSGLTSSCFISHVVKQDSGTPSALEQSSIPKCVTEMPRGNYSKCSLHLEIGFRPSLPSMLFEKHKGESLQPLGNPSPLCADFNVCVGGGSGPGDIWTSFPPSLQKRSYTALESASSYRPLPHYVNLASFLYSLCLP